VDEVVVAGELCVRKREAGEGAGANPTKPSAMARFRARRVKRRWRAMGGGGGRGGYGGGSRGAARSQTRGRRGWGAKSDEIERDGSISGAPCKTTVEGDGGRWWDEVDDVVVVVGLCVRKCEAGGGAGAKSNETERDGSVSGAPCEMAVEGDGGRWWDEVDTMLVVMGLRVRNARQEGLGGPKSQNRAILARFWAAFEQQVVEWGAVGL